MGRLISDRVSYKNHYMCSGEATSVIDKLELREFSKRFKLMNS